MSSRERSERWLQLPGSDGRPLAIRVVDVPRARHLRLSLGRDGPRLSKPRWVSLREAAVFAAEKRDWLEAQLAVQVRVEPVIDWPPGLPAGSRSTLMLRGKPVVLSVADAPRPRLDFDGETLGLHLPARSAAERQRRAGGVLRSFLETQMLRDIHALMPAYVAALGRAPARLRLRPLRSLWGSLSAQDHLSLDLSLILGPPAVLDYVLVHELAHLFERDHGARFWHRVASLLPDYRARQQMLRVEGERMKRMLSVLLDREPAGSPVGNP